MASPIRPAWRSACATLVMRTLAWLVVICHLAACSSAGPAARSTSSAGRHAISRMSVWRTATVRLRGRLLSGPNSRTTRSISSTLPR